MTGEGRSRSPKVDYDPGDRVRCWPGARPGRSYTATALSSIVARFGTYVVRVEKDADEGGGTDWIASTHIEHLTDDARSQS